jgi:hypothetical protein
MLRGVSICKQNRFTGLAPNHQLLCFRPSHASCFSTQKAVNITEIPIFKETRAQVVFPTHLMQFKSYVQDYFRTVFCYTIYIVIKSGTVLNVKGKRLATNGTNWSWWIGTKSLPQPFLSRKKITLRPNRNIHDIVSDIVSIV